MASSQSQGTAILRYPGRGWCQPLPLSPTPYLSLAPFQLLHNSRFEVYRLYPIFTPGVAYMPAGGMGKKKSDRFYHLALITASGKCKRPTHICSGVQSDAGLKRMKQNRDCVRISSTNAVSISAKARLTGYITSFVLCAVNTFAEEGVIRLDEMNE